MPFVLRATYKDETRNVIFNTEDGCQFPNYSDIQSKLRTTFGLPGATCMYMWHVYFSPNDGNGECKFKRHVCSAEEYDDATLPLVTTAFPRPTLIFQVLLSTDSRLSTAHKYHQSVAFTAARAALTVERKALFDAVTRCTVVVTALKSKARACAPEDSVGKRFWSERVSEKVVECNAHADKLKKIDLEIKRLDAVNALNKSAVEKETTRNKESRAEVLAFLENWKKRVERGEDVMPKDSIFGESVEAQARAAAAATTSASLAELMVETPQVLNSGFTEQLVNFADPAETPLPDLAGLKIDEEKKAAPRARADDAPAQAFPSLESILNSRAGARPANPAGTPPLPAVGHSYANLANRLRSVAIPAVESTGERVTGEIKNILDGFLVHLGGQLDAFEGGLKSQYARGRQTVDDAVEKATSTPRAETRSTSTETDEIKVDVKMPGTWAQATSTPKASKFNKTELQALTDAVRHRLKICDSCGEKPAGICYKCDNCADFDLCAACLPRLQTNFHAADHTFTAIPHAAIASKVPTKAVQAAEVKPEVKLASHSASCDVCQGRIKGERYKCLDCPDWDSCSTCFSQVAQLHPQHSFVRINRKEDYILKRKHGRHATHARVVCDSCNGAIVGPRYKCMHPSCLDFDLCEACESSPNRTHPMDHPLLKMRVPGRVQNHSFFDAPNEAPSPPPPAPAGPFGGQMPPPPPPGFGRPGRHGHGHFGPWREPGAFHQHHHGFGGYAHGHHGFPAAPPPPPGMPMAGPPGCPARRGGPGMAPWSGPKFHDRPMHGGMHRGRGCRMGSEPSLSHFHGTQMAPSAEFVQREVDAERTGCASGESVSSEEKPTSVASGSSKSAEVPPYTVPASPSPAPSFQTAVSVPVANLINSTSETELAVSFVEDVTVPDGFPLPPNAQFVKVWKLKNSGQTVISRDCSLKFVGGDDFGLSFQGKSVPLSSDVKPGETFNVSVSLRTPNRVGQNAIGYWRLAKPSGEAFGHRLWTEVKVVDAERESSLSSSSVIMPNMASGSKAATVVDEAVETVPAPMVASKELEVEKTPVVEEPATAEPEVAAAESASATPVAEVEELFSPRSSNAHELDSISTTSWDDSDDEVMHVPGAPRRVVEHNDFSDEEFELLENGSDEE